MRAAVIHQFGGVENVEICDMPRREPKPHEVEVEIHYAGLNPVDWKICEGYLKGRIEHKFPLTLGWDLSGVVSKVGASVKHLHVGDAVFAYARPAIVCEGTYAEYLSLDASVVVKKPQSISFTEAACIPLSALTAWQSLINSAHLKKGQTVFINVGAGGVGSYAIPIAKYMGAHVITAAGTKNLDYVKMLGADEIIDYKQENAHEKLRSLYPNGVDVVFDMLGGKAFQESFTLVKKGGHLVSILGSPEPKMAKEYGITAEFVFVRPDEKELQQIADLIESGVISPPRVQEFPLEDVVSALEQSRAGHTQGKIAISIK